MVARGSFKWSLVRSIRTERGLRVMALDDSAADTWRLDGTDSGNIDRPLLPRRRQDWKQNRGVFLVLFLVAGLHVYFFLFFMHVLALDLDDPAPNEAANLANDEIGNDPDLPTNYHVDRFRKINVPRRVIWNAPDGPPMTIPPPPGFGAQQGSGIGMEDSIHRKTGDIRDRPRRAAKRG